MRLVHGNNTWNNAHFPVASAKPNVWETDGVDIEEQQTVFRQVAELYMPLLNNSKKP